MNVAMPDRIARLERDKRGYPIPWNVLRGDRGEPNFTVNDSSKHMEAVLAGLCPICGERLGVWKWFVGGPRSAFDQYGWYLDLPGHRDCMEFALRVCPYLAAPRYSHFVDVVDRSKLPQATKLLVDETILPDRPEVFVAVASDKVEIKFDPPRLPYVRPARPALAYSFWRHGEQLPEHRVMPILRGIFGADWALPRRMGEISVVESESLGH